MSVERKKLKEKPVNDMEYGSTDEQAYLNKLESDIMDINADYVNYAAEHSDILDNQTSQLSYMQKVRHLMMFSSCITPMAHGITGDSLIQSIGMYAGMRLFDKDFAKNVNKGVAEILSPYVQKKAEEKGEGSKWSKWADKLESAKNDGRTPLDPETAALTQMGFAKRAYEDMRKPGANVDEISGQYEEAVKSLYKVAAHDGVSGDDINQSFKFMVGKMIEHDPETMKYFNETSYSGVTMDDYKPETVVIIGDDGKPAEQTKFTWDGNFRNPDGSDFTGTFTPRRPYSAESYETVCSNFVSENITKATEACSTDAAKAAEDSVVYQIHDSQKTDCEDIDRKLKAGVINNREAGQMKNKVANLDGFSMGVGDLSEPAQKNISKSMTESFSSYMQTAEWESVRDNIFDTMMADDGLSPDEIKGIQSEAIKNGYNDAFVNYSHSVIDKAVNSVKAENQQRTNVNQNFKGRGHEFDDRFSAEDLESDVEYV